MTHQFESTIDFFSSTTAYQKIQSVHPFDLTEVFEIEFDFSENSFSELLEMCKDKRKQKERIPTPKSTIFNSTLFTRSTLVLHRV